MPTFRKEATPTRVQRSRGIRDLVGIPRTTSHDAGSRPMAMELGLEVHLQAPIGSETLR